MLQQKIIFLSENPGAKLKKVEGVAAGASAMPSNNMFAPSQDGELVLENTSSVSPGSLDINNFEYFNPNVDENLKSEIDITSREGKAQLEVRVCNFCRSVLADDPNGRIVQPRELFLWEFREEVT